VISLRFRSRRLNKILKYPVSKDRKGRTKKQRREEKNDKTNNKMTELSPTMSNTTLNVDGLNTQIKG
jgi:hypothetical protein